MLQTTESAVKTAILEVVGRKWLTIPQISSKIGVSSGIDPKEIHDYVAFYSGHLIGEGKLEGKAVALEGGYFYKIRKPIHAE